MGFYIFKVWRHKAPAEAGGLELLHTFPYAPLNEAMVYRRAETRLRELRRAADPRGGYYVHLVYGDDECDAQKRLLAKL